MAYALQRGDVDPPVLLRCFDRYMTEGGHNVTRAQFEANLHGKSTDSDFRDDIEGLLEPTVPWDFEDAMRVVLEQVVAKLPGEPWKGGGA